MKSMLSLLLSFVLTFLLTINGFAADWCSDYGKIVEPDKQIEACTAVIGSPGYKQEVAYGNRCDAYNVKGQYALAISDCNKAIEINPKYSPAYTMRGRAFIALGDNDRALMDYNKAIEINPRDSRALYNIACLYSRKKDSSQACKFLSKALSLEPKLMKYVPTDDAFNNIRNAACYNKITSGN
jgi:tetratricopeptide (TPR) repeat protein